ncbi:MULTISPECIES: biotin transporter BioY [unclassified Archaeoglobus]|jgi:biotin transport system substrate-specific component|uniref:biotin transporter BioY n=1 Tax=unclassified Archaeoglobus TaxID=2643606 RepID=UPI0025C36798|nr:MULTISPECIES: biotin transporter BioY [unclassified Archaeoglobus]
MVDDIKRVVLAIAMALITAISAQLNFKIGPIPYTMQNFGVMLSGFLLGPWYGLLALLVYVALIALSLPFAAGGGGLGVLLGPTAGFIYGFAISAFLAGLLRKMIWRKGVTKEVIMLWLSTLIAVIPTYLLGFAVFYSFAVGDAKLLGWADSAAKTFGFNLSDPFLIVFTATVLIFLPQDFFVDHLLAVLVYRYVHEMLKERGIEID